MEEQPHTITMQRSSSARSLSLSQGNSFASSDFSYCSEFGSDNDDDDDYSSFGSSSDGTGDASSRQTNKNILAKNETQVLFKIRSAVFVILLLSVLSVSLTVHFVTMSAEENEFRDQFETSTLKIFDSFERVIVEDFASLANFASSLTSYARATDSEWPFVTINDFQERASAALSLSDSVFLELLPLVSDLQRERWEAYALENLDWLEDRHQNASGRVARSMQEAELAENTTETDEDATTDLPLAADDFLFVEGLGLSAEVEMATKAPSNLTALSFSEGTANHIFFMNATGEPVIDPGPELYAPGWQSSPLVEKNKVNLNWLQDEQLATGIINTVSSGEVTLGHIDSSSEIDGVFVRGNTGTPISKVFFPVFDKHEKDSRAPVAVLVAFIDWATFFEHAYSNEAGIFVVLENSCDGPFTYLLKQDGVEFLGPGDLHELSYERMMETVGFGDLFTPEKIAKLQLSISQGSCKYLLRAYPSTEFHNEYTSNVPIAMTVVVAIVFVFMGSMFFVYDKLVERRQNLVMRSAMQSEAIVSSLFPENVRSRLASNASMNRRKLKRDVDENSMSGSQRLNAFLKDGEDEGENPIADLFPHATVLFADISGFTAWSSTREPAQVFNLLQTVYQAFDTIAKHYGVFKVETIGDSYMAATGLPNPQSNHAILMAKFAFDCLAKMAELTKQLEVKLGPDTGDLAMRFGMHSGEVTAGVLRGDRARFQLFGDTVNTASRMESTGNRDKIQVSNATALLLIEADKGHWLTPRIDPVHAKGKGMMKTFWIEKKHKKGSLTSSVKAHDKKDRLVQWAVELLTQHVKKLIAHRITFGIVADEGSTLDLGSDGQDTDRIPLDELTIAILFPSRDLDQIVPPPDHQSIKLGPTIVQQLQGMVEDIAEAYRDNPYHNFEHACCAMMCADKLIRQLEQNDDVDVHFTDVVDPLTGLATVFSALIHDAGHNGTTNEQIVLQKTAMATRYRGQSISEQNALDIGWSIFSSEDFAELRRLLFCSQADLLRFRQILVKTVLAADVVNKEAAASRNERWTATFGKAAPGNDEPLDDDNLKASIILELLVQAADVAHTMQHWSVFQKWNKLRFQESHLAFAANRAAQNPSEYWFEQELQHFDDFVIPLAEKLKESNAFGPTGGECLEFALRNRAEFKECGREAIEDMDQICGLAHQSGQTKRGSFH